MLVFGRAFTSLYCLAVLSDRKIVVRNKCVLDKIAPFYTYHFSGRKKLVSFSTKLHRFYRIGVKMAGECGRFVEWVNRRK